MRISANNPARQRTARRVAMNHATDGGGNEATAQPKLNRSMGLWMATALGRKEVDRV
jgi:hypothetical protein